MLIVTTAATVEPVTLTEAKAQLRETGTANDTMIGALITAAREAVELETGRALAAAAYRWASTDAMAEVMRLPLWPVATLTAVSYEDADGARQTMDAADYSLDADRAQVTLELPDFGINPSFSFTVSPTNIPVALKQAILLIVADLYANTEATSTEILSANPTVSRLLALNRVNYGV
jgi:uncharacterized phiE125 gp8 family phage protein